PVVALVGHHPTNPLIGRELIPSRKTFHHSRCLRQSYPVLIPVSRSYPRVKGRLLTCYSPVRRSSTPKGLSARLACVKHAASVRPEPGSNSPLMSINNRRIRERIVNIEECPENRPEPASEAIMATSCESVRGNHGHHQLTRFVLQVHLAFSTLLSSQETSALLAGTFIPGSGRCLNLT